MKLFHIISTTDWAEARLGNTYAPESLAAEGFIHLSQRHQILRPANLLYRGRVDLCLLVIDSRRLRADVVYEPGSHGESENFPHLYGPLDVDAVIDVVPFAPEGNGEFTLPDQLPV